MRVLITTPTFPPFNSGLGNAVQRQASELVSAGLDVVVATAGSKRGQCIDQDSGAKVETFAVNGADYLGNPIRGDHASYVDYLVEGSFDLVIMNAWQNWATDLCLRNLSAIRGRKILYSHCLSTDLFIARQPIRSMVRYCMWRPYRWRLSKALRSLDGLIVLADHGCDSRFGDLALARKIGIKVEVVPNSVSAGAAKRAASAPVAKEKRGYVVAVGAYEWQKGHEFALKAYARSSAKNVIPLRLYGQRFTSFTDALKDLARRLGVDPHCFSVHEGFSGDELLTQMSGAVALVSGSYTECQPLVLLDAMSTGTPFVARATGCIPWLAGGVGVETLSEASQALDKLLSSDSCWQAVSDAGRAAVRARHAPGAFRSAFIGALERFGRD